MLGGTDPQEARMARSPFCTTSGAGNSSGQCLRFSAFSEVTFPARKRKAQKFILSSVESMGRENCLHIKEKNKDLLRIWGRWTGVCNLLWKKPAGKADRTDEAQATKVSEQTRGHRKTGRSGGTKPLCHLKCLLAVTKPLKGI